MDIKPRMKFGLRKSDLITIKFIFYEILPREFYKMILAGEIPKAFQLFFTEYLTDKKVDYQTIRQH